MKFTLGWLKDHLETDASLEQIAEKLTALGLEVEEVTDKAVLYAPFKVAYVEKAVPHPNADRLKLCIVDTGEEKLQVVCGAPNARTGMKGVFAPVGSHIPGIDLDLKKGKIRGEESHGMLVSEREMGLSDEHEGIIDLPEDTPVGTPFAALFGLDDPVIEIALTPDRADCAGVRGIARDLAAAGLGTLKPLDTSPVKPDGKSPIDVIFDFKAEEKDACPLFVGRYIKGVKNGPSPEWMQRRLKAIGLRPISALVDITNYLSFGLCRPLHVFDADKIKGDLHLRLSQKGEKFTGLDEKEYTLDEGRTVICDESGVINLAGIMGGLSTGCSNETVNVYLECAYFDPVRTAKTGRALQINSDARYRFERGIDPAFTIPAAELATRLILELCGGEAYETVITGQEPDWKRTIAYDPSYLQKLCGFDLPAARQKEVLEALGFEVAGSGPFNVQPPSWRGDIEGKADLTEEIARIHGYDNIDSVSLKKDTNITMPAETELLQKTRKAREALAAKGLFESITWSFMPSDIAQIFGANDNQTAAKMKLLNPISSDLDQMRPTPLANLVMAAGKNANNGFPDNAIFEVGPGFITPRPDGQQTVAAGVRSGYWRPRHWSEKDQHRPVDAFDAKADALEVLAACGAPESVQVTRDAPSWYHPGRSGVLRLGANVIAQFGELHPGVRDTLGIRGPVIGFEVFLNAIPAPRKKKLGAAKSLLELSAFQPVSRDFAFLVDEKVEAGELTQAAYSADKRLITQVNIFDVYQGKGVEPGKKSVAINVILQPFEKTLTDEDLEKLSRQIIDNVTRKTGGSLRG